MICLPPRRAFCCASRRVFAAVVPLCQGSAAQCTRLSSALTWDITEYPLLAARSLCHRPAACRCLHACAASVWVGGGGLQRWPTGSRRSADSKSPCPRPSCRVEGLRTIYTSPSPAPAAVALAAKRSRRAGSIHVRQRIRALGGKRTAKHSKSRMMAGW
jgi:hypothetical protein